MSARQVAVATIVVLSVLVSAYLVWLALEVVLLLFLGILLASAIEPAVDRLRRGPFSRGQGVLMVYTMIVGAIAIVLVLVIPPMLQQITSFSEEMPGRLDDLRNQAATIGARPLRDAAVRVIQWAQSFVAGGAAPAEPSTVVDVGLGVAHLVVAIVTVFVIAYYWLVERASLKRTVLRLSGPRHARRVNLLWVAIESRLGAWLRGQLVLMGAVGLGLGIGYVVLGLPGAFALAIWAALAEMIPMVGPYIAVAPALLIALTSDAQTALFLLLYAVIIQSLEGYVLVPRVMSHAVGVSPLVVFLGILVGAALGGLTGAFLAVPIAGTLQVVLQDLFSSDQAVAARAEEAGADDLPSDSSDIHDGVSNMPSHAHAVMPGGRISGESAGSGSSATPSSTAAFALFGASRFTLKR